MSSSSSSRYSLGSQNELDRANAEEVRELLPPRPKPNWQEVNEVEYAKLQSKWMELFGR